MPSNSNMRCGHAGAVVLVALMFTGVSRVPAFAQSNSARWWTAPALSSTSRPSGDIVRAYGAARNALEHTVELPPNLAYPQIMRSTLEAMLRRSAVFRRQCLRLAHASHVRIALRSAQKPNYADGAAPRALSRIILAADGGIFAAVELRTIRDLPELIAHEIEHVLEQLDGIDLRASAGRSDTGVRLCADGSYETTRAVRIGEAVARQMEAGG